MDTQFFSGTKKLSVAIDNAIKDACRICIIDTEKANIKYEDYSQGLKGHGIEVENYSRASAEVIFTGEIPPRAITMLLDLEQVRSFYNTISDSDRLMLERMEERMPGIVGKDGFPSKFQETEKAKREALERLKSFFDRLQQTRDISKDDFDKIGPACRLYMQIYGTERDRKRGRIDGRSVSFRRVEAYWDRADSGRRQLEEAYDHRRRAAVEILMKSDYYVESKEDALFAIKVDPENITWVSDELQNDPDVQTLLREITPGYAREESGIYIPAPDSRIILPGAAQQKAEEQSIPAPDI